VSPSRRGPRRRSRRSRRSLPRLWYVGPQTPTGRLRTTRRSCRGFGTAEWQTGGLEADSDGIQGTTDVRVDPQLNKKVWEQGVKGVGYRLRIRISRRRNDEEGAKEKLYSYVQAVNVKNPKGLHTVVVEE
jgi:large subunit ribosomal protein L31e